MWEVQDQLVSVARVLQGGVLGDEGERSVSAPITLYSLATKLFDWVAPQESSHQPSIIGGQSVRDDPLTQLRVLNREITGIGSVLKGPGEWAQERGNPFGTLLGHSLRRRWWSDLA